MVEIRGLRKSYGKVNALNGVDFGIKRGRVTAYLGTNGAGKTTTIKILLGLLRPDAGSVVGDYMRAGYIPDRPRFLPWLSGRALMDDTAAAYGVTKDEVAARLELYAGKLRFDLRDLERRPSAYSNGNAKKAAYLQSLLIEPDLIVADEPFSALDPPSIKAVRDLFREMRDGGRTLFLSSHMLSEMEKLADDAVIIRSGVIAASFALGEGTRKDLEQEFLRLTEG